VKIENTHLFQNQVGMSADGSNGVNVDGSQIKPNPSFTFPKTAITVFANNIEENTNAGTAVSPPTASGLYVKQAFIAFETVGVGINGNIVGNNGWQTPDANTFDVMCMGTEIASQTEFEGKVPLLGLDTTDDCTINHDDQHEAACNADRPRHCIFNPDAAANKCRRAYDLSTASCNDTNANQISGYDRVGSENEDVKVGIVVKDGAWVNAEDDSFLTTAFQVDLDWTPIQSISFASNAGTTCPSAAKKCPTSPRAIFP